MANIYVKKDGSGDSATIQGGIQLAQVGDIVNIEAGTFDENLDLWKDVTLMGAGMGSTIVTGAIRSAITSKTFTWTLGATTLTIFGAGNNTSQYEVGRIISGTGIPANTRIVSKTSTTLVISAATTQATTTARSVAMALQNDATVRMRGVGPKLENLKVVGFDGASPGSEFPAIYFKNAGLGSVPCTQFSVKNCEIEAKGEGALLSDYINTVGNGTVEGCIISGKTFTGSVPGIGNQYSVANVPRALVFFGSPNLPITFKNNTITAVTGGVASTGLPSYNTAVTVDAPSSTVTGNTFNGVFGTGFALRCRNVMTIEDNINYSIAPYTNNGYYFGASGSEQVGMNVGTNSSITAELISVEQTAGESFVTFEMSKEVLKQHSAVSSHAVFSNEANWNMVSYVFKHNSSARRLVGSFKDFSSPKKSKLKPNMAIGDTFELHKIILATSPRDLLVLKRSQISGASGFDFNLVSDGPEESNGGGGGIPFQLFADFQSVNPLTDPTFLERTVDGFSSPISQALHNISLGAIVNGEAYYDITFNLSSLTANLGYGLYFGVLGSSLNSASVTLGEISSNYESLAATCLVNSGTNMNIVNSYSGGNNSFTVPTGAAKTIRIRQQGTTLEYYVNSTLISTVTVSSSVNVPYLYPYLRSSWAYTVDSVTMSSVSVYE